MRTLKTVLVVALFSGMASAQWGHALQFDGVNQYAHYGYPVIALDRNFTMELWVKWGGSIGATQCMMMNGNSAGNGYGFYITDGGQPLILLGGITFFYAQDGSHNAITLTAGTWVHLAAICNNDGDWALYINGTSCVLYSAEVGYTAHQYPSVPTIYDDFGVGANAKGGGAEPFKGVVDEVRFSSGVRYSSNFSPPDHPFVNDGNTFNLYHFSEGSGTTTADSSSSGDNLVLVNSPTWAINDNPLPVEMSSFSATANRLTALLRWSTATETNNFAFDVERKASTTGWVKIGSINGAGTSTSIHSYSYIDYVGQAGTYEYRIKQFDKTGAFKYSSAMQVEVGSVAKVLSLGANYPNPFNPSTSIEFSVPSDGRVVLKVYNIVGQEVATLFDGVAMAGTLQKATFDASRLPSGVYFSRMEFGGSVMVKRMMLLK